MLRGRSARGRRTSPAGESAGRVAVLLDGLADPADRPADGEERRAGIRGEAEHARQRGESEIDGWLLGVADPAASAKSSRLRRGSPTAGVSASAVQTLELESLGHRDLQGVLRHICAAVGAGQPRAVSRRTPSPADVTSIA